MTRYSMEKVKPFYDQIYNKIREMILHAHLKPGEQISESQMARLFYTSRSPVREAVKALIKEGLLVTDERSRIFVYEPTFKDIIEIYQCRMALESLAAKLTAIHGTDEQLKELESIIKQTEQLIANEKENREKLIGLNTKFHESIILFSQNIILQKQLKAINSLSYYFRVLNFKGKDRGRELYLEHKEIYHFIELHDTENAAQAMMKHIENDLIHFRYLYDSNELNDLNGGNDNEKRT